MPFLAASFLDHLNRYVGAYSVLSSLVQAVITTIYVVLTYGLLQENRRMRMQQTESALQVSVMPTRSSVFAIALRIENIGSGPARHVRLKCHPEAIHVSAKAPPNREPILMSKFGPFRHGIPVLPPGSAIELPLTYLSLNWQPTDHEFRVMATYDTVHGGKREDSFTLGFAHRDGISWPEAPEAHIAQELQRLTDQIRSIAQNLPRR